MIEIDSQIRKISSRILCRSKYSNVKGLKCRILNNADSSIEFRPFVGAKQLPYLREHFPFCIIFHFSILHSLNSNSVSRAEERARTKNYNLTPNSAPKSDIFIKFCRLYGAETFHGESRSHYRHQVGNILRTFQPRNDN